MEDGEAEDYHLGVLELHKGVAVMFVLHLFDPEGGVDDGGLSVLLRLVGRRGFAAEELDVPDASAELRHGDLNLRSCSAGVGRGQEADGRGGGDIEDRAFESVTRVDQALDFFLEQEDGIVDDVLHGNTVDVRRQRRLWWSSVKGRSSVECERWIKGPRWYGADRNSHIVLRKRCSWHRRGGEFLR